MRMRMSDIKSWLVLARGSQDQHQVWLIGRGSWLLQVAWLDESNPAAGFSYLYLSEEDHGRLVAGAQDPPVVAGGAAGAAAPDAASVLDSCALCACFIACMGQQQGQHCTCTCAALAGVSKHGQGWRGCVPA